MSTSGKATIENRLNDIRVSIFTLIGFWKYFVVSILLFFTLSFIYLKYTTPSYVSTLKLLVRGDKGNGESQLTEEELFNDLGINVGSQNIDNEIEILKSTNLMSDVVNRLGLHIITIKKGNIRDVDLYNDVPISILNWHPKEKTAKPIYFELNSPKGNSKFELNYNGKIIKSEFGKLIQFEEGSFTIIRKIANEDREITDIGIKLYDVETRAAELSSRLSISLVNKKSAVLSLTMSDNHPLRSKDVLNELVNSYNISQVNDKNRILANTLNFLNNRINIITNEVKSIDGEVQNFKSRNNIIDLSNEGDIILNEANENNKALTEISVQEQILQSIKENLNQNSNNFDFIPTNSGLTNLTLSQLLNTFNQLLLEREKIKSSLGSSHPSNSIVTQQLTNLRLSILENISFLAKDIQINKNALLAKESIFSKRIVSLPVKERQLIEVQRQQIIKQNLYNYLLQKREEAALRLAIAVPSSRIVEPAKIGKKFKPNTNTIWTIAGLTGFFVPLLFLRLYLFFSDKIRTEQDLHSISNLPILGTIAQSGIKKSIVVNEVSRSPIAEMFRLIRANFQFIGNGINNRVILLTSSVSGEGKTFICINFGLTLAFTGKKVCIVELDMRKPKFQNSIEIDRDNRKGITEFLVDEKIDWNSIVVTTNLHPNLYAIVSGIIPPNPTELLLSDRLNMLIEKLKDNFDYIILDTPPVGMVSDALLLAQKVDTSLYVVRQDKTLKSHLNILNDLNKDGKLPRPYILLNGIKYNKKGYRYGYGYGYGYGYYEESKRKV